MKKLFAIVLTLALAASMLCVVAHAEAKNYVTHQWNADIFPGAIKLNDDGTAEYSKINAGWFGPTLDVYEDLVTMMGDKTEMDITIKFAIKVRFKAGHEDSETTFNALIRGYAPQSLLDTLADKDDWNDAYAESLDGDDAVFSSNSGNILTYLPEQSVTVNDTEWTDYETSLVLTKGNLNPKYFENMRMTFDTINDYELIDAIIIKDFGIYLTEEIEADKPTPEPTAEPTATHEATATPAPTEAPAVTDAPAATDEPAAPEKKGCGSLLALGLLAAVIPAAIVARKKEN